MTTLNILFLVDCLPDIGAGHLVRCLAIADALTQSSEATCTFLSVISNDNYRRMLADSRHTLIECHHTIASEGYPEELRRRLKQQKSDFIIVDSYQLSPYTDHTILSSFQWMLLDDWPHRQTSATLLLDSTFERSPGEYDGLVSADARVLTGSSYVPLRQAFVSDAITQNIRDQLRKILIFMGATDPTGDCLKIAQTLHPLSGFEFTVLIAESSPGYQELTQIAASQNHWTVISFCDDMHRLLLNHDLVIGAPGSNSWERCATATPAITLCQEKNQEALGEALANRGATIHLGYIDDKIQNVLPAALNSASTHIETMSRVSANICDGKGATRIAQYILNYSNSVYGN